MTAVVAPATVAAAEPFLLTDQMDAIGQLVVVPDENWDAMVEWTERNLLLPGKNATIIETDKGPFMIILDEDIDPTKPYNEPELEEQQRS